MHTIKTFICIFLLSVPFSVTAFEPVDDQQLMFYYHIPLGADKQQDAGHQFGLRFDRTVHDPRDTVQLDLLEKQPAVMDFRMGYSGIKSIKLHGVEYASYLVARAAAEEESADAATPTDTGAGDDTAAGGEETSEADEKPAEESEFAKKLKDLPVGVYVGVLIGIGIIAGVGG